MISISSSTRERFNVESTIPIWYFRFNYTLFIHFTLSSTQTNNCKFLLIVDNITRNYSKPIKYVKILCFQ